MNIIRRAIQPLICLMILVGTVAHANTYVLNGNPTGLVSSAGAGSYSGGHYSASDSGTGSFAHGPATFNYVWQKSTTVPEDAPLTVIVHVQTLATVWGAGSGSSAFNGYGYAPAGAILQTNADEYIVQSGGTNVAFTIDPSASAGPNSQGYCAVDICVDVIPVTVGLSGVAWLQKEGAAKNDPKSPHIEIGELAQSTLAAGGLSLSNHSWTITGDYFRWWTTGEFDPAPSWRDSSYVLLTVPSPAWRWNDSTTSPRKATGSATVAMAANVYNPTSAAVQDEYEVTVVRPVVDAIEKLRFLTTYPLDAIYGGKWWVTTGALVKSGTVAKTKRFSPEGQYCFAQTIATSTRFPLSTDWPYNPVTEALDGHFPYAHKQQTYPLGDPANFEDGPAHDSPVQPVGFDDLKADDEYAITLMFKAGSANANWVPLQNCTWKWKKRYGEDGTQSSTQWAATTAFPTWTTLHEEIE